MAKSLTTGETCYARNPRTLLLPASNMKIVTLAAIAERHGWDHTFPTTLSIAGRIAGGVLDGDLVVAGRDPSSVFADGSATGLIAPNASGSPSRTSTDARR
jgi:D-alanyl-D-alanine carboxypeptidase/D-alanyl-D-alanine-endopeptidase (penicillin-binding protein 4)